MTVEKQLNISVKHNLLVGLLTGIWLFLFLLLIKPFKQERLDNTHLFYLAISMSLSIILCYFIIIIIQNKLYRKFGKWNLKYEITVIFIFLSLSLIGSFIIYKSSIANGSYNLFRFFFKDYLPTASILLPLTITLRRYFFKHSKTDKQQFIYLYGENKLDYLKLKKKDLISISSLQNYVEISFLIKNDLHKKLLRTSLKKIHSKLPFLIKTHRSHLINPAHFISFKDKKNLVLTKKEIPFSVKFKNNIAPN